MDKFRLGVILVVLAFLLVVGDLMFISRYQENSLGENGNEEGNESGNQTIVDESETHNVVIGKFAFTPRKLTINQGDSVNWVNSESEGYHVLVSFGGHEISTKKIFPGENYTHTFEEKGEFKYLSVVNEMEGTIFVE